MLGSTHKTCMGVGSPRPASHPLVTGSPCLDSKELALEATIQRQMLITPHLEQLLTIF